MKREIDKNTPVSITEVIMDYMYLGEIKTTLGNALEEIARKNEEDEHKGYYHILLEGNPFERIATVVSSVTLYGDNCDVDNQVLAELLFANGDFGFKLERKCWSTKMSMLAAGLSAEYVDELLGKQVRNFKVD